MQLYLGPYISPEPFNNRKRISEKEKQEIARLYPDNPNKAIAHKFGRTASSIKNMAVKNGWVKSAEYKASKPGCYRKGEKPWNKGVKKYMGANRTSFKQGSVPANHKPMGTISLRYHKNDDKHYRYIKTPEGWVLFHRHNWEKANGKIPPGHVLTFLDGDISNCDISNLKMISQRENMERNRNREKAARSMRELWRKEWLHKQYGLKPISKFANRVR